MREEVESYSKLENHISSPEDVLPRPSSRERAMTERPGKAILRLFSGSFYGERLSENLDFAAAACRGADHTMIAISFGCARAAQRQSTCHTVWQRIHLANWTNSATVIHDSEYPRGKVKSVKAR